MILTIISHTPHYELDKKVYGWGPTITEINYLSKFFTEINHIAPLHAEDPPKSTKNYNSDKIKFIPIIPRGGKGILNKIEIIYGIPEQLKLINKYCRLSDWVQFRSPTNMGIYVLPYLRFFCDTNYWVKYAGDWYISSAPISYRLQRFWLKYNFNKSVVTVNGQGKNRKDHIFSLENPCVTDNEIIKAKLITKKKDYSGNLILCFVGLISDKKGLGIFISALKKIKNNDFIKMVYIVGGGSKIDFYKEKVKNIFNIKIKFTGPIIREELNKIYSKSHIIILPSFSEGFPKVIGEASAYGCVPIVSNVGSISKFINKRNGILLKKNIDSEVYNALIILKNNRAKLRKMSLECNLLAKNFTYTKYLKSLLEILKIK